jgi:putative ABC transport system permease protein
MFRNYFKTAWRNLKNARVYSTINILGLSFGLSVSILIGLWIFDETSYDKNFDNYDRIARVIQHVTNNGEVQTWRQVPYPLSNELRQNYGSDFKHIALMAEYNEHILSYEDKRLSKGGAYFETEGPEILSLHMIEGRREALKDDPSSILLSESVARSYFENGNAIGKTMKIDNNLPVKVAGIYQDMPRNSSFTDLGFIASWDLLYSSGNWVKTMSDPWRPNAFTLIVQLADNVDINAASARIKDAKLKKINAQLAQKKPALLLHAMSDWHLRNEFKNGINTGGSIRYVWMFGIIGIFVLLLACINFMNLSTARSEKRAREVGIRKTLGSLRSQLILQFFSESFLTIIIAFAFSLLFAQLALPYFNSLAQKSMHIPWSNSWFWIFAFCFILITGLISGSYPAFYLSSFRPVKVLKGSFKTGRLASIPRKVLVTVQFTVSVALIIGTIAVYQQINYTKNRPVGYERERLVSVNTRDGRIHEHFEVAKRELMQSGAIVAMAEAGSPTTRIWNTTSGFKWPGKDPNLSTDFAAVSCSFDYGKTIGWQIKEGRDFSKEFATDSSAVILNEAAIAFMGLKDPVGKPVTWWDQQLTIIGVVKNMVIESPYEDARPTIYNLSNEAGAVALMKLNPANSANSSIASIEKVFKSIDPEQPFSYQFMDEDYARKFEDEERIGKLAASFAILAILISCLGLFGLVSFIAEQRTKEISIRKVLGASTYNVWNLLSKDFMILVLISFVIAIPVSYYFMHNWLQGYNYRTTLSWWIFAAAGGGAILITMLTVSFQAIKAALANPVKSLRSE